MVAGQLECAQRIRYSQIRQFVNENGFCYFFGPDLSGKMFGAGGIVGLVAVSMDGNFYFPIYDRNGNIIAYINEQGSPVAQYQYDAFGNNIESSGDIAQSFTIRFSTKYCDLETDLVYYGYRFYNPSCGRWLNRDPIEEDGGYNLYSFCKNDCLNKIDFYGLWELTLISDKTSTGDVALWKIFRPFSEVVSNISSVRSMLTVMKSKVAEKGKISHLNISGHGIFEGIGVQFEDSQS